jgi:hypothetical protein
MLARTLHLPVDGPDDMPSNTTPNLQIIVDGDHLRVYRRGERVTGRVILVTTEPDHFRSLTVSFNGTCATKTSPSHPPNGCNAGPTQAREHIRLFNFDQELLTRCTLAPGKHCWTFDFRFPDKTEPTFTRWQHGPKYHRGPHELPPTFQAQTHVSGGYVTVSYLLVARLQKTGSPCSLNVEEPLPYHPTPRNMTLDAKLVSRVLYAQTWKPLGGRTAIDKALKRLSRHTPADTDAPRIVPTLHYPERISPGQHIPLLLSLTNSEGTSSCDIAAGSKQCVLESVTVAITTHTTSVCSQNIAQPEYVKTKHVVCLSNDNINTPVPFGIRTKLTNNFRLVDNAECVPSFRTYNITRRYDLIIAIGIRYGDRTFRIRCTTLLDILPRIPRELFPGRQEDADADTEPLPLYAAREPSAPDYESLFSLSRMPSNSNSSTYTKSGSATSSVASSGQSTPASEVDEPDFLRSTSSGTASVDIEQSSVMGK